MNVFIVIPVHNRRDLTRDCLTSLDRQSREDFQVIVVDDGSTDGTEDMIRQEFPSVTVLQGGGDLWWVGAVNLGIRYALDACAPDDCILLLNNDLVVAEDYLSRLNRVAASFPETLIGSVVAHIGRENKIYSGGVRINWKTAKWEELNRGKRLSSFPDGYYERVSTLTGRGVLIPTRVFRDVGLYKPHYVQCGDAELPVRAARAGYSLIVHYSLVVFGQFRDDSDINNQSRYTILDLKDYFWNIKSHTDLRTKFWFAFDALPNFWQGVRFWVLDLLRTVGHFMLRLRLC